MSISRGLEIHAELLPHLLLWVEHYVCNSILVSLHEDLQTVPYFYVICGEIFLLLFLEKKSKNGTPYCANLLQNGLKI